MSDLDRVLNGVRNPDPVLRQDVMSLTSELRGSLKPELDAERGLVLKGTLPTTYQGNTYHTPVLIRLANYPRVPPVVKVMPTETMQPFTRATGYRMEHDGTVSVDYAARWMAGSNLLNLIREVRSKFNIEPPLYSVPAGTRQQPPVAQHQPAQLNPEVEDRVRQFFNRVPQNTYAEPVAVISHVTELIQTYKSLQMEFAEGQVQLRGTLPTRYRGNTYHIPVQVRIPVHYPKEGSLGLPQAFVVPTRDMHIKPNHRHVDGNGRVYCDYLSEWKRQTHSLLGMAKVLIQVFEGEPPVYAAPAPRTSGAGLAAQPAQPAQPTPQPARPAAQPAASSGGPSKADMIRKVQDAKTFKNEDDDEKACLICYENKKDVLLRPCNHICLCASCVKPVLDDKMQCPVCRKTIQDVVPGVFF